MGGKVFYSGVVILILNILLVSALPGVPHQFYGSVEVNNQPVPDNTVIVATVDGDEYSTVTTSGRYGYSPNIFYVEDPDGDRSGKTISFNIGGMEVGTYEFVNNGYTELEFSLTTDCGDDYCLGDETCTSCPEDCGVCTGLPVITIFSPVEGNAYDSTKIDVEVTANQDILVWMYSLNGGYPITFTPDIVLTADEGNNTLTVLAINNVYQTGSKTVSFSVDSQLNCGDGIKNNEEECDTSDFGGSSCASYGFNAGSLSCTANCTIETNACYNSGSTDTGNDDGGGSSGSSRRHSSGGGFIVQTADEEDECSPEWVCSEWSDCTDNLQKRACVDNNKCDTEEAKPAEQRDCEIVKGEVIFDDEDLYTNKPSEESDTGIAEDEKKSGLDAITGFVAANPVATGAGSFVVLIVILGLLLFLSRKIK
ncbi:hypothetical protein JXB41_02895 [Candidatus Woesearchaeota archaeon]|nr:hypothetical protein [Candidatus Woesearchaeota archaeon]